MDGFCLYGCVASQIVLALIGFENLPQEDQDFEEGSDEANLHLEVVRRLQLASAMMGKAEQAFDFAASSAWGLVPTMALSILEVFQWNRWGSPRVGPSVRPSALELMRKHQSCDPILDSCWRPSGDRVTLRSRGGGTVFGPLVVTVFGDHGMLSRDAMQSLEEAAASLHVKMEPIFVGDYYLCEDDIYACEEDPSKELLKSWVHRWQQDDVGDPVREADALTAALRAHPHPRALEPDLYFCTNLAVQCWLVRRRSALKHIVGRVPAIHYLGMAFLALVPLTWRTDMMSDFRKLWEESQAIYPQDSVRDIFVTFMETLVLQLQWQLGIVVPFVPSLGLARKQGSVYDPPDALAGAHYSVIVLRSAFWGLPAGRVFATLLRRMAEANMATHSTDVSWLGRYTSIAQEGAGVTWHTFDDIARHTCALDIPAEFSQIKFRDVYSMGLPLLLPEDQWMLRLFKKMYRSWGQLNSEWRDRLPVPTDSREEPGESATALAEAAAWPHEPFYDGGKDSLARLQYWLPLADHVRYPHVQFFHSLPHMFDVVVSTSWADISVRMRAHFRGVVRNVERFYRVSLLALLPPGRGA